MKKHVLRIGAAERHPWVVQDRRDNSSVYGVAIEIYKELKHKGIFDFHLHVSHEHGGSIVNNKWTGFVGAITRNETDVAGPLFVTEQRAQVIQYSTPLTYSKLGLLSGLVPANKNPFLIFSIFSIYVWIAILVSVFVSAGGAGLIYSILPSGHPKKKLRAYYSFIWIFGTSLLGQEFAANNKKYIRHIWPSRSFKLLQGIWILSCLVLTYTYQGKIISSYAADYMKPKFQSLDDIVAEPRAKFGTIKDFYALLCLRKLANTDLNDIWVRIQQNLVESHTPWWLDWVEEGTASYLYDLTHSKYLVGERFRKTGKCGIRVIPVEICASSRAFVLRKELDQDIIGQFNDRVLRFTEGALIRRHLTESLLFYDICTQSSEGKSTTHSLDLSDLLGAFTVLGTGLLISILYFAVEMVTGRNKKQAK